MIKQLLHALVFSAMIAASFVASADEDQITLGEPEYGGTGCPAGTAATILSPDKTSLTILFDQFVVEAGGANPVIARKNCDIGIPVSIPQGYSYSIVQIDYRGYAFLPRGATATFTADYFFSDSPSMVSTGRSFNGPMDGDYLITNRLGVEAVVWSRCGADANLRIKSSMRSRSNSRRDETLATVDSADISSGVVYHFRWKRC